MPVTAKSPDRSIGPEIGLLFADHLALRRWQAATGPFVWFWFPSPHLDLDPHPDHDLLLLTSLLRSSCIYILLTNKMFFTIIIFIRQKFIWQINCRSIFFSAVNYIAVTISVGFFTFCNIIAVFTKNEKILRNIIREAVTYKSIMFALVRAGQKSHLKPGLLVDERTCRFWKLILILLQYNTLFSISVSNCDGRKHIPKLVEFRKAHIFYFVRTLHKV